MSEETVNAQGVNAQGVGTFAAQSAGCGNLSVMLSLAKVLISIGTPLWKCAGGGDEKKKPKDPNMTLSLFCGVSRSNGATDGKGPPQPGQPPKEKEGSSFWPFAAKTSTPNVTPPQNPTAKVSSQPAINPQGAGVFSKSAGPGIGAAPKLREVPDLVIQPHWRHMDPADDLNISDLLRSESDEIESDEQSTEVDLEEDAAVESTDQPDEPEEPKKTKKLTSKQRKALKKKERNAAKKQKFMTPEFITV